MSVGLSATLANSILDNEVGDYTWIKLHTGDPGAAGTSNAATETTRKQATWAAGSAGATSNTGALQWTSVAGSEDYTHFSVWTASTAGTFGWSGTITANAVTTADTFTIPIGDLDASLPVAA
jgi:hypothetical protein